MANLTIDIDNRGIRMSILKNYLEAIKVSVPETLLTSTEIEEWRLSRRGGVGGILLMAWLYTSNVSLYGMKEKTPVHFFGGREAFLKLYLPNIDTVCAEIVKENSPGYVLPSEDTQWVIGEGLSSGALKRFDLEKLVEYTDCNEDGFYIINTAHPDELTKERKAHAELIYGKGEIFNAVMKMYSDCHFNHLFVRLLSPEYVKDFCDKKILLIGRGSVFSHRSDGSGFDGRYHELAQVLPAFMGVPADNTGEYLDYVKYLATVKNNPAEGK